MEAVKRGPGRPKKEVEKEFDALSEPEKILYLYQNGYTDSGVCRGLEVSKEQFDERYKEDEEFRHWISFGRTLCQAWWEDKYRDSANGAKLNAPMVNFAMKNLFGWAEKSETTNHDLLAIEGLSRDQALQELRNRAPALAEIIEMRPKKTA